MQVCVIYPADTKKDKDTVSFYVPAVSPTAEAQEILETVFRQFNHVDGSEHIAKLPIRSMCIGDIVAFMDGGRKFICEPMGWKQVSDEFVKAYLEAKIPFGDRLMGLEWVKKKYPYL